MASKNPIATSVWEWVVAVVGGTLVLALLVYMTVYGLQHRGEFPVIKVEAAPPRAAGDLFAVPIRASNESSSPAAEIKIKGELRQDDRTIDEAEVTLDYLPPFSRREAGLLFRENPGQFKLVVTPQGYREP